MTFTEIARKYKTDKVDYHNYGTFYEELFDARRDQTWKVLEIGVGHPACMGHVAGYATGASLRTWEEYFPNAIVYGLDVRSDVLVNAGRIRCYQANQRDKDSLRSVVPSLGGDFDLIVDDGTHCADDQVSTANVLMPLLAKNGVYVIEDVTWPSPAFSSLRAAWQMVEFNPTDLMPDDRIVYFAKKDIFS